jgi:hypothetical protein
MGELIMAKKMKSVFVDRKDTIEAMETMMSPEAVQRVRLKAEQEILTIKLGKAKRKKKKCC